MVQVEMQRGQHTGLIVLVAVLAIALVALLLNMVPLVGPLGNHRGHTGAVNRGVTSSVSLEEAGRQAWARAYSWSPNARLVRVEAAWYPEDGWETVSTPPVAWAFSFFDAPTASLATVIIDDDTSLWVPPTEIPTVPTVITVFPPLQGVESVWLSFRAAGGERFLRAHSDAQVTFRLRTINGTLCWVVSAFAQGDYLKTTIDATTGLVLQSDS